MALEHTHQPCYINDKNLSQLKESLFVLHQLATRRNGRLSFYHIFYIFHYIFSQSHRLPAEFDAGFCFHDGKNLESFAGVLIGLLKYSQLALLKTTIFLIPIMLYPRNLSSIFVLFLSRDIVICMVNGFSQD